MKNWWRAGGMRRILQMALIGAYLLGNGLWIVRLIDRGRGDYSRAMSWMAVQSTEGAATVSSDHDFRNRLVFDYYANHLWSGRCPLTYIEQNSIPRQGTDWVIRHDFEGDPPNPNAITDFAGITYKLERTFRHQSLTGWNWWIYRRQSKSVK